ncbi:GNAT family N-acetyltransferase [Alkaliphilus hydrothermalis]|uniref:Ribosomal-protein-alanine N-acetyltransferase n=1 Tax=Alkaliphilus hydrothermalis TaxID=1482730 RepID=A0ABS2NPX0_9FIRM|nr:GNAT family N-acetyltransferase [Alkaliphilus hydrothermalis]MBM7614882.1 ribosomal-protein-alanine N-acetyltransferase [Alkaliphilus hydrothermalis]
MRIEFKNPTETDAIDIATWKYEGEYSFYNNDKTEVKQQWARNIHTEENAFVLYNDEQELMGNFSFDYDDEKDVFMFGVQMRPSLTGRGMGTEIISAVLDFGREKYKFDKLELLVAKFNKRAIRVYEKLGFEKIDELTWFVNNQDTEFIAMRKSY